MREQRQDGNPDNLYNPEYLKKLDAQQRVFKPSQGKSSSSRVSPLEKLNHLLATEQKNQVDVEDSLILQAMDDHFYLCHLISTGNKVFIEALKPTILAMMRNGDVFKPYFSPFCKAIATYAKDESSLATVREILDVAFELHPEWLLQLPVTNENQKILFLAVAQDNICLAKYCLEKFRIAYPSLPERLKQNAFRQMYMQYNNSLYDIAPKESHEMIKLLIQHLVILFSITITDEEINAQFEKVYPDFNPKILLTDAKEFKEYVSRADALTNDTVIITDPVYISLCLRELILLHLATSTQRSRLYAQMSRQDNAEHSLVVAKINTVNHDILIKIANFLAAQQHELRQNISLRRKAYDFLKNFNRNSDATYHNGYKFWTFSSDLAIFTLVCVFIDTIGTVTNPSQRRFLKQHYENQMCKTEFTTRCVSKSWRCSVLPSSFDEYGSSTDPEFKTRYEDCNLSFNLWTASGCLIAIVSLTIFFRIVFNDDKIPFFGAFSNVILQNIFIKPLIWLLEAPNENFVEKATLINMLIALNTVLLSYFTEPAAKNVLDRNLAILAKNYDYISMSDLITVIENISPWVERIKSFETILPEEIPVPENYVKIIECPGWTSMGNNNNDISEFQRLLPSSDSQYGSINVAYTV
jgi:hypothetical protein